MFLVRVGGKISHSLALGKRITQRLSLLKTRDAVQRFLDTRSYCTPNINTSSKLKSTSNNSGTPWTSPVSRLGTNSTPLLREFGEKIGVAHSQDGRRLLPLHDSKMMRSQNSAITALGKYRMRMTTDDFFGDEMTFFLVSGEWGMGGARWMCPM